ncbi:Peptidyl-prolyl cis-trans isomerase pin4 [Coemansia sp. RSA 552]|nr:Peptidyl-prolyl cis-trans isomerase pin4 [Coemansia sp. RSA 552]
MSKAVEETLRSLERAHISEPSAEVSSPSPASTVSAASPLQSAEAPAVLGSKDAAPTAAPLVGAVDRPDDDAGAGRRPRRAVQSMYGAPPGYNATMGVGGGRDALGRGRVASGRQRNSIMVPDQLQAAMHPQSIAPPSALQPPAMRLTGAEFALMANMPDDAIPNAIVVKNINFAIKREELLQTIADRGLPLPYAFNYHFDGTMFRGLAFGNFRTAEEAARVIVGLNGVSLLGRPLKVEYKKALPGTVPPLHPNTIAMMSSASSAMPSDAHGDGGYGGPLQSQQHQHQHRYDQPIPRGRRGQNGESAERPRSMMIFPSAMSTPDAGQQSNKGQSQAPDGALPSAADMIDLDDADTRSVYDLISGFRHNKSMGELEFPSGLNTRQRQIVMLVAERFGLNHETKSDANGRTIRVYKGLDTLLEGAEVRRRSMASPSAPSLGSSHTPRYNSSAGRSRPSSMLYPDTMSMGGMTSPPPPQQQHQHQQRMGLYQQQQQPPQSYHDPSRVRSYTHSQGANQFAQQQFHQYAQPQPQHPQQQQQQQPAFSREGSHPGRASGSYVGYPSRLYQDSVVVPARQPRGPDMTQNFVGRQQIQQQEERQAQRQAQLKVLQQNRQRRLSATTEEAPSAVTAAAAADPSFKIANPGSKAIPIVRPSDEAGSGSSSPSQPSSGQDDPPQSVADAKTE